MLAKLDIWWQGLMVLSQTILMADRHVFFYKSSVYAGVFRKGTLEVKQVVTM